MLQYLFAIFPKLHRDNSFSFHKLSNQVTLESREWKDLIVHFHYYRIQFARETQLFFVSAATGKTRRPLVSTIKGRISSGDTCR